MDLARFLFPYWWIPKRWVSSLFEHNAGRPTKTVCSVMMAEAFASVHFPIRPVLHQDDNGDLVLYRRNTRLITPSEFDYSPYFDVIKYPILDLDDLAVYRKLPWDRTGVHLKESGDDSEVDKLDIDLIETSYRGPDVTSDKAQSNDIAKPDAPSGDAGEPTNTEPNLKQQQNI
jgi:hypothetical protein